jgi:hypothetical protein
MLLQGNVDDREKIIWNFDNVQKAYATRGYEANVDDRERDNHLEF